jgi:hypothetical protein
LPKYRRKKGIFADLLYTIADDVEAAYHLVDVITRPVRKFLGLAVQEVARDTEKIIVEGIKGAIQLAEQFSREENGYVEEETENGFLDIEEPEGGLEVGNGEDREY